MTTDRPRPLRRLRHPRLRLLAAALAGLLLLTGSTLSATAAPESAPTGGSSGAAKPTIVLVHGAFADSSGWNDVASRLMRDGYPVIAFSNPLRGPLADAEYLRQFLSTISGPVVLVGHSYGGAVITNAGTGNPNVKSLVYIAAYALAAGESLAQANTLGGGHTDLPDHLVFRPYPGAAPGDADAYIDPAWVPILFAQDLPKSTARVLGATQRPAAVSSLFTPSGAPAWETIPSWYLVARQDRTIPPEAERAMAARAGSTTVEINSSHVAMMSHPSTVVSLIKDAARG
jgi:pimeloyl-ACP methyl ester carboxylesterase